MISEKEIEKLIRLSWLELRFSAPLYDVDLDTGRLIADIPEGYTEESLVEKRRQEQSEHGLVLKSFDPETKFLEFVPIIPFLPDNCELSHEVIERIEIEGRAVREKLERMNQESAGYRDKDDNWMVADASIPEISIFPNMNEMKIVMDGVTDYDESLIRSLRVELLLKNVQRYQIMKIENGVATMDDQEKRQSLHYDIIGGTIKNDYYELYQNGYYTLLILYPETNGMCIQVDYEKMEIRKEVKEDFFYKGTQG